MRNLAGLPEIAAAGAVLAELHDAGIRAVAVDPGNEEVRAQVGGQIVAGGYDIRLSRRWVYWSASVHKAPDDGEPRLPELLAQALNDAPWDGSGTKYSGYTKVLGSVVRARGFAGGLPSTELGRGVDHWHIDTPEALEAFASWCRQNLK